MSGFTFKQFHINHDRCAMKVGTDGILLGAWAPIDVTESPRILDIGCGSGLIALMLAQRCKGNAVILGVDIDADAVQQAQDNAKASPWPESLCFTLMDVAQLGDDARFDLIVSNPPYYPAGQQTRSQARQTARHTVALDAHKFMQKASSVLADFGQIAVIIPDEAADAWREQAAAQGLYCIHELKVKATPDKTVFRQVLLFASQPKPLTSSLLVIRDAQNRYTSDWVALTREFYLKM